MRAWVAPLARALTAPLRPTLVRRVVFALMFAFLAAYLVNLAWSTYAFRHQVPDTLPQFASQFFGAIDTLEDPASARAALAALDRVVTAQTKSNDGQRPGVGLWLRDRSTPVPETVYRSVVLDGVALETNPKAPCVLHGQPCSSVLVMSARWEFRMFGEHLSYPRAFVAANELLLPRFLVAFPLLLLPLWLAVAGGMRPLSLLSRHIAARRSEDLTPLEQDLRYGELRPLGQALNTMFGKVRLRIERERAFVEDAAHELRTPLAVIAAQAHVLARARAPDARDQAEQQMSHAMERASHLVQQLLSLARMDSATPPATAPLNLAELLREQLANHAALAAREGIELTLDAPDHLQVDSDRQALCSIVGNLVENALRYAGAGAQVDLGLRRSATGVTIVVQDNGPGIAAAEHERVFERFYRGRQANQKHSLGSGLGLAIVKQAVHRLGGDLSLTSGPEGRGCVFRVELHTPAATAGR